MFEPELKKIQVTQGLRRIDSFTRRKGPWVELSGSPPLLDFSSNDYLGLSQDERLKHKAAKALEEHGMGSGGSRLLGGSFHAMDELEYRVAEFIGKETALLFGSGYLANIGIISSLGRLKNARFFLDRLVHSSLIDGILLSKRPFKRFRHNDPNHLEELLRQDTGRALKIVVVEGVYSMDGDLCPYEEILELKQRYGFLLLVDDAHGIGVFGDKGTGTIPLDLRDQVDIIIGTFGKAFGGYGAFCATTRGARDYLINTARSFIFSTAIPIPVCAWNLESLDIASGMGKERKKVLELAQGLRTFLKKTLGLSSPSHSQIVPIIIGPTEKAVEVARRLVGHGIFLKAVRPPTVPVNTARLRVSITARHTLEHIRHLEETLRHAL